MFQLQVKYFYFPKVSLFGISNSKLKMNLSEELWRETKMFYLKMFTVIDEVSIVKVICASQTRCGNKLRKTFIVDRERILKALLWLKKYNCLYKDVIIEETRLSWMGNRKTRELNSIISISSDSTQEDLFKDRYVSSFNLPDQ